MLKSRPFQSTLYFYNNEPSKNKHFPILLSSLARYLQEPKLERIFEISWVLFEKISIFYSDWPKSWIWRIFCRCHLHKASKEVFWPNEFLNFMHSFKSAILAIFQFWQIGTFEPVHEIQKFFWPKDFFSSLMKMTLTKNIPNMSQGPPNPGCRSVRVENGDFLKKDLQDFKSSFQIGFLWIHSFCFISNAW